MNENSGGTLFAPEGGYGVRILDLSGGNDDDPVEIVGSFPTLTLANAFARRYVRDSLERCRMRGMSAEDVLQAWHTFGEDAEVVNREGVPVDQGWRSSDEISSFSENPVEDPEDRNWRILDPRAVEEEDTDDGGDGE
ncbi:hypothetical protein ACFOD4_12510 [Pseudoroseomonas globiformis]|uniref:Uncharacterized protein n=1 Tax=Teichococcus globiformis TaxID=2307229 RepID=A0ABV7FZP6_9PROT